MSDKKIDVIITLGNGSKSDNDELRIALRSLEKHADIGNVYIATTAQVPWLTNVIIEPVDDPWRTNKDKNLINKVVYVLKKHPEIDDFLLYSDDFVLLQDIDFSNFKNVYNDRGYALMSSIASTRWQKRLLSTLELVKFAGGDASVNWDSHTPLKLNRKTILDSIDNFSWDSLAANYTLCTFLAFIAGLKKEDGVLQDTVKCTCEDAGSKIDTTKMLLGYNDMAFHTGLRTELFKLFPDRSKYEVNNYTPRIAVFVKNLKEADKDALLMRVVEMQRCICMLVPLDAESADTLKQTKGIEFYDVDEITAFLNGIELFKKRADYAIVYDAAYTYTDNYFKSMFDDIVSNALVIDDTDTSKLAFRLMDASSVIAKHKNDIVNYSDIAVVLKTYLLPSVDIK